MKIKDKNEYLNLVYQNNQDMIKFADSKASTALTIQSILISAGMAGTILSNTFQILNTTIKENFLTVFWIYIITLIIFLLTTIAGVIISIIIIYPRIPKEKEEIAREGTFYFGHIAKYKESGKYITKIESLSNENLSEEFCKQIFQLATIADKKMKILSRLFPILIGNLGYAIIVLIFTIILHLI